MANGTTNNTGFFSKAIAFFKGNPVFAVLSGLFLLAFIMPPRSRKYRRKQRAARRRRRRGTTSVKSTTGPRRKKGKKTKSGKKIPRSVGVPRTRTRTRTKRTRTSSSAKPAWMVKGSKAAKDHMDHLRSMRKKT